MITAHPLEFPLLQYPQERDLRFHREIANFIQEERAAVSGFKPSHTPLQCAGESSFLVPEKLGSDQRLRNRRTVDADEGSVGTFRSSMQRASNQLFAGSRLPQE